MLELYIMAIVLMIVSPLSAVIYGAGKAMDKFVFKGKKWGNLILISLGVVAVTIGLVTKSIIVPWEIIKRLIARVDFLHVLPVSYIPVSVFRWIISDFVTVGAALVLETVALIFAKYTPEKMMVDYERRRERKKQELKEISTVPKTSQLCFGVSGAGKSAYIGKSIEDILTADPDACCIVVDGKGSAEKYSLYDNMKIIARKTGKRLVVINGTGNPALGNNVYDFLDGIESINAAKEMIMTLITDPAVEVSSGSDHYQKRTELYIMDILSFMRRAGISITFHNVVELLDPEKLIAYMENKHIDPVEQRIMRKIVETEWEDAQANISKLEMLLMDEGERIFVGEKEWPRVNLRSAYEQGDIVLVLADEMSMPTLAGKLVQLVTMDLRNLIAGRLDGIIDMDNTVYGYFDEFSSYTSAVSIIQSIYARARSAGVIMTLATQSCSDIIRMDPRWFYALCDTADRYVVFRQNSAEAAEEAAKIFGTELHVTATARSRELAFSGEASNTLDRAYKVHPDTIRELPTNHGILLDKRTQEIVYFENKFVSRN